MTEDSEWQDECADYIGRSILAHDDMSPQNANGLLSTLDDEPGLEAGDELPHLFHWLYFNTLPRARDLKSDGHEKLGAFLPPVRYPHRMWAGSAVTFHHPLVLGRAATKRSTIRSVEFKTGSRGPLCFVQIEHEHEQDGVPCLTDVQTIVYIGKAREKDEVKLAVAGPGDRFVDVVALFRYSALTLNSHRIHYDVDYARDHEGYKGLVVHGPLIATLLLRQAIAERPAGIPEHFTFQGRAPLIAGEGFRIESEAVNKETSLVLVKSDGTQVSVGTLRWKA